MSASSVLIQKINDGLYDDRFARLYGDDVKAQRERYIDAVNGFVQTFGEPETQLQLFSAPGRTGIGGNHTDHNHGRVLAGSVNLDVIAVVAPTKENRIRVQSKGYPMDTISLARATASSLVFIKAPLPTLTSNKILSQPAAIFLLIILEAISEILSTVAVTSRKA